MRILQVITSMATGGAESLVAQIAPLMHDKGCEVEVALFDGHDSHLKRQLLDSGIKVHSFAVGGSVYHPRHILKLRKLMRGFDIVHTHNYSPQLFAVLAGLGRKTKLVTTEHASSNRRRNKLAFRILDKWMYRRYDRIICISDIAGTELVNYMPICRGCSVTINNGIDVERFGCAQSSGVLEQLAPGSKKLIMVAGFRWEKDQDTLIKSLKLLPTEFHLFLVGDGVRRKELHDLAVSEGVETRVHFMGLRTDVPQLLKAADYVVMSSHFEGLSLSSVEGMAAGRPMIASDVNGLREVVGGYGCLFPEGNSKALADIVLNLDSKPDMYQSVSEACRRHANDYDINRMVEGYIEEYQNILRNAKS